MRLVSRHNYVEPFFDLTSMVDVVLLLVIFFMLSSQFASVMLRPMDLPREAGDPSIRTERAEGAVVIDLDREARLYVSGREVPLDRLTAMLEHDLAEYRRRGDEIAVIVRADRSAEASVLDRVASELQRLGVDSWRLATAGESAASETRP